MSIRYSKFILDFWLPKNNSLAEYNKLFVQNTNYDKEIKEKFGYILTEINEGKGFNWLLSKDTYIAYIILINQFPKYIYRNNKKAYSNDSGLLIFTEMGIDIYKHELTAPEFICALLPYIYSELSIYQNKGTQLFKEIMYELNARKRDNNNMIFKFNGLTVKDYDIFNNISNFISQNSIIIRKFNRFPERNNILGRISTPQEINYLNKKIF
jgi:uncharacterized protein (DUF924 family)